jgi:hypothetical protein
MRLGREDTDQRRFRGPRLTYANVVATLALFLALTGGSAFAASKLITGGQIAKGTITSANIKSGSLLSKDFKKGQLPKGATGAPGATGATGAAGAAGPAGSAVAYATVVVNGTGNPTLVGAVGFTTITNPQSGVYCVGPVISGHTTIVATPVATSVTVATYSPQQCSGDYEFGTSNGSDFTDGQGFNVVVP